MDESTLIKEEIIWTCIQNHGVDFLTHDNLSQVLGIPETVLFQRYPTPAHWIVWLFDKRFETVCWDDLVTSLSLSVDKALEAILRHLDALEPYRIPLQRIADALLVSPLIILPVTTFFQHYLSQALEKLSLPHGWVQKTMWIMILTRLCFRWLRAQDVTRWCHQELVRFQKLLMNENPLQEAF